MVVVASYMECFANAMVCFEMRFPYCLLYPWEESTLGFGFIRDSGRGLCHTCLFNAVAEGPYDYLEVNLGYSHCSWVSCFFCNVFVRLDIARLCLSRKVVKKFL